MASPVFLYYELKNFHQNHRKYVKSKSVAQLKGNTNLDMDDLEEDCNPALLQKDTGTTTSWNGNPILDEAIASPCGLIAKSMFTDTFALETSANTQISISQTNIAWKSDIKYKFKRTDHSAEE